MRPVTKLYQSSRQNKRPSRPPLSLGLGVSHPSRHESSNPSEQHSTKEFISNILNAKAQLSLRS
ncbi:hypothetical protein PtB15_1B352 [Puccinia triticina]|nr:hypothetical protein PtB15_1B352 [Puccinia triticina]